MRRRTVAAAIIAAIAVLVILGRLSSLAVDWLWFSAIGYFAVFRTIVEAKTVVFRAAERIAEASAALAKDFGDPRPDSATIIVKAPVNLTWLIEIAGVVAGIARAR
jgi:uncharacterized membrane protein (UPF0182 family)